MNKDSLRVLVISQSLQMSDLLLSTLPATQYSPIVPVTTIGEAQRKLVDESFDILVINTPLADDFGVQAAINIISTRSIGILLLVKADIYDSVTYKVEDYGIVTLPKPTSKQALYSSIKMISVMQSSIKKMESETLNLRAKMDEIRIINRAKWILIDQLNMKETQAHRHIEKQAMDRCVTRLEIAENIIRTYDR